MKKIRLFSLFLSLLLLASCDSKEQKIKEACLLDRVEQISTPEAMKRLNLSEINNLQHPLDWKIVAQFCKNLEQTH